ncbi:VCBS domain-containing protein, partial [Larsenimonas rhizosphaerae]
TEDTVLTTSGTLTATDTDAGESAFVAQPGTAGTYGSFAIDASGNWSYQLDNTNGDVQALGDGDTLTETFTVTTAGGDRETVTVTINGTNDAAEITGVQTGTVQEDAIFSTSGILSVTDADQGEASFVPQGSTVGQYGTFTLLSTGIWTYALDNANADVQALGAGENKIENFTVTTVGGDTETVTITINGTNDAPIATSDTFTVAEDTTLTLLPSALLANDTDIDGDALTILGVGSATNGAVQLNEDGTVTFTPDGNFSGVASFDYLVSDGKGGTSVATASIGVVAVADAPVVSAVLGETLESVRNESISIVDGASVINVDNGLISGANVVKGPFSVFELEPGSGGNTLDSDVIVLEGNFNSLVEGGLPLLSIDGGGKDYLYLAGDYSLYDVLLGEYLTGSGYEGTLVELSTGSIISLSNIRGLIFEDGTTVLPEGASSTVSEGGYDVIELTVSALLSDTDGSEALSGITLSGIPDGVTVEGGGAQLLEGGNWYLPNPDGSDMSGLVLTLNVPLSGDTFSVQARAVVTEAANGATAEGTAVSASIERYSELAGSPGEDTLIGTGGNDIMIGDAAGMKLVAGQNYNIAILMDTSSSLSAESVDQARAALKSAFSTLKQSADAPAAGTVNLFLADFDHRVERSISLDLADPDALSRLDTVLDAMSNDGGTNYEDAFKTAANWFQSDVVLANSGQNLTYFITDGEPTYYNQEFNTFRAVDRALSSDVNYTFDASGYVPGQPVYLSTSFGTFEVLDANGTVYAYSEVLLVGWTRTAIGTVEPNGAGSHELAYLAGDGYVTDTTIANADSSFALLGSVSTVETIGIGTYLNEDQLSGYDSDGVVQANVDPSELGNAILAGNVEAAPSGDSLLGAAGDDILFGDRFHVPGSESDGLEGLRQYVAQQTGVSDPDSLDTSALHEYIQSNPDTVDFRETSGANDVLNGGAGDDLLFGQGGDDLLIGGSGNDILTGGTGADIFAWMQGDDGTSDAPAEDHITDFSLTEGDVIDLSDMLDIDSADADLLAQYLHVTSGDDGSSTIEVSPQGASGGATQKIVVDNTDLTSLGGSDAEILRQMVDGGNLKTQMDG